MYVNIGKIRFVLVETSSAGNIGAAARAMKTMGVTDLALVNPCEYRTYECYARASGAYDVLDNAKVCQTLEAAIGDCSLVIGTSARLRSLAWPQIAPHELGDTVQPVAEQTVAVVFGRERSGLSNEELALCSTLVVIPTVADFSSLNISAAVQVIAYELRRAHLAVEQTGQMVVNGPVDESGASASLPPAKERDKVARGDLPATHAELDHFYQHLETTMTEIGYLDPDNPRMMLPRFRRLFNRVRMTRSEVQMLRGLLGALSKRAKHQ